MNSRDMRLNLNFAPHRGQIEQKAYRIAGAVIDNAAQNEKIRTA